MVVWHCGWLKQIGKKTKQGLLKTKTGAGKIFFRGAFFSSGLLGGGGLAGRVSDGVAKRCCMSMRFCPKSLIFADNEVMYSSDYDAQNIA